MCVVLFLKLVLNDMRRGESLFELEHDSVVCSIFVWMDGWMDRWMDGWMDG